MLNTVLNNHQLLIWIQTTFELEDGKMGLQGRLGIDTRRCPGGGQTQTLSKNGYVVPFDRVFHDSLIFPALTILHLLACHVDNSCGIPCGGLVVVE